MLLHLTMISYFVPGKGYISEMLHTYACKTNRFIFQLTALDCLIRSIYILSFLIPFTYLLNYLNQVPVLGQTLILGVKRLHVVEETKPEFLQRDRFVPAKMFLVVSKSPC